MIKLACLLCVSNDVVIYHVYVCLRYPEQGSKTDGWIPLEARRKGEGTYATGAGFHDASGTNEFRGGNMTGRQDQQPCIDCGKYGHRTQKSKKCEKHANFDPATAAKRCTDCARRGHSSLRSKLCPKHAANLPVSTVTGPVDGSAEEVSNQPSPVNDPLTEQIVEDFFVQHEELSSTSDPRTSVGVNAASTSLSLRLPGTLYQVVETELSVSESTHHGNVGTSTETGVESEDHELENILDSVDELLRSILTETASPPSLDQRTAALLPIVVRSLRGRSATTRM
eukprot:scaffold289471_cov57-Attheya_sp.AAC.2